MTCRFRLHFDSIVASMVVPFSFVELLEFDSRSGSLGLWQSLLTIECSPCNGEALKLVFPGVGVTEDASRISAGRAALVHFSTF